MENKVLDSAAAGKCEENAENLRKKVVVLVDDSPEAKLALLWTLSHVVNDFDTLMLLYIVDSQKTVLSTYLKNKAFVSSGKAHGRNLEAKGFDLANSLKALCKARRPQVQTEVHVVGGGGGEKGPTIVNEVKKLKASVLVLGQERPSVFQRMLHTKRDGLVEYCIANTKCLTLGVRKQSSKLGGYIINSRSHKNFWLLA